MDVQLKELIDKIRNDGVKNAEENAIRIIDEAKEQAVAIVQNAQKKADRIRETAQADAEKFERNGREALRQAGRDLVLAVKARIEFLFEGILVRETSEAIEGGLLSELIFTAVKSLSESDTAALDVLVSENDFSRVEADLIDRLGREIASGIEIKPFKGLDAGFRISLKDGSAFYDFSDHEIAAMLGKYLNLSLANILST